MGRQSSIDATLSDEDKAKLNELIGSGKLTLDGLQEWLGERGYEISRSSLHRYAVNVRRVSEKLRESRQVTEALVKEIGPETSDGKQGRLLVEVLRSLVFDFQMKLMEEGNAADDLQPGDFMFLAKALKEMAQAARLDQDFELKIRDRFVKEQEDKLEKMKKDGGLSAEQVRFWREEFLGVRQPGAEEEK